MVSFIPEAFFPIAFFVCHLVGDYCLQSDWMAQQKTSSSMPALAHAVTYTVPFLLLTQSVEALAFIAGTHFIIDRWRIARHVGWVKNFLAPPWINLEVLRCRGMNGIRHASVSASRSPGEDPVKCPDCGSSLAVVGTMVAPNYPWRECSGTGYHKSKPAWLAVWLLIITDNTMHLICNAFALIWWAS